MVKKKKETKVKKRVTVTKSKLVDEIEHKVVSFNPPKFESGFEVVMYFTDKDHFKIVRKDQI